MEINKKERLAEITEKLNKSAFNKQYHVVFKLDLEKGTITTSHNRGCKLNRHALLAYCNEVMIDNKKLCLFTLSTAWEGNYTYISLSFDFSKLYYQQLEQDKE